MKRFVCRVLTIALVLVHLPVRAADIVVEGDCTLVEAIHAANNDDDSGGLCPPGGSGADTLILTGDVILDEVDNTVNGATGLPRIVSDITIAAGGFRVERDPAAPEFRLFDLGGASMLQLEGATLRYGVATGGPWDCEAAGLGVSPGDRVRQFFLGSAAGEAAGGTAIGVGDLNVDCLNRTTGESVRFAPVGALSWSCAAQGFAVSEDDRLLQTVDGLAD